MHVIVFLHSSYHFSPTELQPCCVGKEYSHQSCNLAPPEKSLVHNIIVVASSAPTNSDIVLLLVFNFCFQDIDIIAPLPIVIATPV